MATGNGGPAYPVRLENWSTEEKVGFDNDVVKPNSFLHYPGMTLRDYFAAQYLVGRGPIDASHEGGGELFWGEMAADCYAAADALIAERAK